MAKKLKKKTKTSRVVWVQWTDPAFAKTGWTMLGGEFEEWIREGLHRSDTVGVLAFENDELIVVVQSIGENQIADSVKISKSAIKKITQIGEVPIALNLDLQ